MKNLYGSNICIIAPHPDDEVLGLGGSISKFSKNNIKVNLLVISGHLPPLYPKKSFEITKEECLKSAEILGLNDIQFAEIPATYIHNEPISKLNGIIQSFILKSIFFLNLSLIVVTISSFFEFVLSFIRFS